MLKEAKEDHRRVERELGASLELCHSKIDDNLNMMEEQDKKFENCPKMITDLTSENLYLKKKLNFLEERLELSEQYSRINCVDIFGLPEKANENVLETVQSLGTALDMTITDEMVDTCHRLGKTIEGKPPPGIIVKFVRRADKQKLLQKKKQKKDLGYRAKNVIFIKSSPSPERRRLLVAMKLKKKEKQLAFVWTTDEDKILVRKEEGGPVI